MRKKSKRGVMQLPFGMIFSIILIVAFIAVAFYAIKAFLGVKKCSEIGMFKEDLQQAIDRAYASDGTSETFSSTLPSSIDYVCFVDISKEGKGGKSEYYESLKKYGYSPNVNMFFYPLKKATDCNMEKFEILHIDIEKITEEENPYCTGNVDGKVQIKIEKGIYDASVCVGDECSSSDGGENTDSTEFTCPAERTINCMPIVPPERANLCSGSYYEWIKDNCNVQFTY